MKTKPIIVFILLIVASLKIHSQPIQIILNSASGFDVKLNATINFEIINPGITKNVKIVTQLQNQNQVTIATGGINNSAILSGINTFNTINNPEISYSNITQGSVLDALGTLPFGSYTFCVSVYELPIMNEPIASACIGINNTVISPPMLNYPVNNQEINELNPTLVWLPASPNTNLSITYGLKIVEILPNQTAFDAIAINPAIFIANNLAQTSLIYPLSAMPLQFNKDYAWTVNASQNQTLIATTDVWLFKIRQVQANNNTEKHSNMAMILAENNQATKPIIMQNEILFQSDELIHDDLPKITLINNSNREIINQEHYTIGNLSNGTFVVKFINPQNFSNKEFTLEVESLKRVHLYGSFKFITD